jgi:hypothetical protein
MQERDFDLKVLNRKIIRCAIIEAPFLAIAVLLMVFGGQNGFYLGIVLAVVGTAVAGALIIRAVTRLECPECGGPCVRRGAMGFDCQRCNIHWRGNVPTGA